MKFTLFLCIATILQASATTMYAQKITINQKNIPLKQVFNQLRLQGNFDVFYNGSTLSNLNNVSVSVNQGSAQDVLNEALANLPLTYTINDKFIVIKRKETIVSENLQPVKDSTVAGTVVDAKNNSSIPGATVSIKTRKGLVVTDRDGNFILNAHTGDSILVSFIGFMPGKAKVTTLNKRYIIRLTENVKNLNEVTVNGIFTRKNSTYTGSASTFSQEDIFRAGNQNVIQSLANLDPAFAIIQNNTAGSNPNVLPQIQLRGQTGLPSTASAVTGFASTANDPNQPLFILDGFETTLQKVIDLDMYRIESITLLKDAASKAIYGSKAANGVVVITTIRPKPGELRLTYNLNGGVTAPDLSSYHLTDAAQKLQTEVNAGIYTSGSSYNPLATSTTPVTAAGQYTLLTRYNNILKNVVSGVNTDWLVKPLQNGFNQRHSLRIEGGDTRLVYGIDLGYLQNTGVMKGSGRNTFTGDIDLNYRVKNIMIGNVLTIGSTHSTNSPWGDFSAYAAMNPYYPYTDANGNLLKQINTVVESGISTPVYNPAYNSTLGSFDKSKYTDITDNLSVDWTLTRELRFIARFSVTAQTNSTDTYKAADDTYFTSAVYQSGTGIYRKGSYSQGNGTANNLASNATLNYTKKIGKSTAALNGGYDVTDQESAGNSYSVEGLPNPMLILPSQALQYTLNTTPVSYESTVRSFGLFASGNYAYAEKYLFDGTYRGTESSQFGSNNRWGQFWSLGVGWNLNYENFLKNVTVIDRLKLRATTGFTGSQGFSPYQSIGTYSYYQSANYQNGNGAYLLGLANPDLSWQKRKDNNFGVDFGLLKKISGRFDYYVSTTDGTITTISLPTSTGFAGYVANLGIVQNTGFDLNLTYSIYNNAAKGNFLNVFFAISHNKEILKKISSALESYNATAKASTSTLPKTLFVEGQSMNAIYAVPSLGIDPASGKELYRALNGSVTNTYNSADLVVVGDALPKYNANFGFSVSQAGFTVNATFNTQFGGQMYNTTLASQVENANIYNNVDVRVLTQRWTKPGDIAYFKSITDRTVTQATSRFVENNNTLTMSSLQLQYQLDKLKMIKKLGFSRFRVGIQSNSLFVLSSIETERGTSYPFAREIDFSLNANF